MLLETLVLKTHLGLLVPAAAPPLGMTARLLLALVLGGFGAVVGWVVALRIAAKARPVPQVLKMAEVDVDDAMPWPGMAEEPAAAEPRLVIEIAEEAPAVPTAAQRIAAAELADLSHVELVERLAIAIRRRQERLRAAAADGVGPAGPVVRFPGIADRQSARLVPPAPSPRPIPQETEKALREALANLQRMSGAG
jgi:hypothetical protein